MPRNGVVTTLWAQEKQNLLKAHRLKAVDLDLEAGVKRAKLQALCKKYLPGYVKDLPTEKLNPQYEQAAARARKLDAWQQQQGRKDANPSTGVYKLTEAIRGFEGA